MIFWSLLGWLIMIVLGLLLVAWLGLLAWRVVMAVFAVGLWLLEQGMVLIAGLLCVAWWPLGWASRIGCALGRRMRWV